jgi:hypothetical protein
MIEKTNAELVALAKLYKMANGKYPESAAEINLKTLNIPRILQENAGTIIFFWAPMELEYLLLYLGKHIQDCYDYDTKSTE